MNWSQTPNIITMLRILLVVPTGWLLWTAMYPEALILMAIAGASDAMDGALARRYRWGSQFGAAMDPVADKLLVVVMFVIFTLQGHIPLWVAIVVVVRDTIILGGAGVYRLLFKEIEMSPTFASKANTAMQIVTVLLMLLALCEFGMLSEIATRLVDPWCFYILAVLGVGSGIDYVITWSAKAWRKAHGQPQ